jgi:hypothetical protein
MHGRGLSVSRGGPGWKWGRWKGWAKGRQRGDTRWEKKKGGSSWFQEIGVLSHPFISPGDACVPGPVE